MLHDGQIALLKIHRIDMFWDCASMMAEAVYWTAWVGSNLSEFSSSNLQNMKEY